MPTVGEIEARIEVFRDRCKRQGLRLTPQRTEVYRAVATSDDHPHADDVLRDVRRRIPDISPDSVYRILYWLEGEGLIGRVYGTGGRLRFDGNATQHHHAICTQCGAIMDFDMADVGRLRLPRDIGRWGRIDERQLQLRGVCHRCLAKGGAGGKHP